MSKKRPVLGVIGGSGLYDVAEIQGKETLELDTPFGPPSAPIVGGTIADQKVYFLARHGQGHRFTPSEVPYRANVHAMKQLGVTHLLSISAVGSLKEEIEPGHLVVPDQIIDRTRGNRPFTFFGDGIVVHVPMASPYCDTFADEVRKAAVASGAVVHDGGTLVVIEGPQFSTRAESFLYRSWDAHLVGMTAMPEARLAREASLCYATFALATDYDCWYEGHDSVTVEGVIAVMKKNIEKARKTLVQLAQTLPQCTCTCQTTVKDAVITSPEAIPEATRARLALLLDEQND